MLNFLEEEARIKAESEKHRIWKEGAKMEIDPDPGIGWYYAGMYQKKLTPPLRPFQTYRTITKGRRRGYLEILVGSGKILVIEQAQVQRWPACTLRRRDR